MSNEAILQFRKAVNASDAMKNEIRAFSRGSRDEFVAMGARHGFEFTEAELAGVAESVRNELTDFELEMVTGGTLPVGPMAAHPVPPQPYRRPAGSSNC